MRPAFGAGIALTRLNERIARSPVGAGWIERQNFADACASLWIDGEFLHLEDLVLHDAKDVINDNDQPVIPQSMVPAVNALLQPHDSDKDLPAFVPSADDDADA